MTFEKLNTKRIRNIGKIFDSDFTRNRKMPFNDLIRCILNKEGKTTTMEINNYFKKVNKREQRVSKQAFSKQRCKLNPEVFKVLNKEYIESIYSENSYKTYKGYILLAIDGTILEIPNTEELRDQYGCQVSNIEGVRKVARAKASGLYDVENNIMIDAILDKFNTPERTLAKKNIENMDSILGKDKKVLIVFDRGYISTEMLLNLSELSICYLFRVQGNTYNKEKESMITNDDWIDLKVNGSRLVKIQDEKLKKKGAEIKKLSVRIVKITFKTGEIEYLITNVPSEEISTEEMEEVYFKRWGIEIAYDIIKNKLYIENISGGKKIIVEQDFYSQILLFNMIEDLKNDANKELESKRTKILKYDYKVNINILIGTFREYMIKIAIEDRPDERKILYEYMLEEIMENIIPIRPDRSLERKTYKGKNKHKLNGRRNS
ncbi:MAG: IS4 family transposase [Tissierella sp.]|uniref:IS4 family transposase n=1 Tax=Tissierella sp. TaxID=41274 RepID=UPI003F9548DE